MEPEPIAFMLRLLYAGTLFPLGACVGSFLNVVVYRTPIGLSIVSPPSSCPSCGNRILARDNLPILGWLLLGGRCRSCGEPISIRYPLVELATALLWAAAGWQLVSLPHGHWTNVGIGLVRLAFISAMVATILIDIDHLIILDEISLGGTAVALAASALLPEIHHAASAYDFAWTHPVLYELFGALAPWIRGLASSVAGLLTGLLFSLAIYYGGTALFRKQIEAAREEDPEIDSALGLGDVKLMACFGALFGWESIFFVFIVGSFLGVFVGVSMKIRTGDPEGATGLAGIANRWRSGASVIPFGPFLAAGGLAYLFFGETLLERFASTLY